MDKKHLSDYYNHNAARYNQAVEKEKKILLWLSLLRLTVFATGTVTSWICFTMSAAFGTVVLLFSFLIFLYLIKMFTVHTQKQEHFENLVRINKDEALALSGDYSVFGDGSAFADQYHDFSFDIDVFGRSSLFQFLNRTATGYGQEVLAGWLKYPDKQVEHLVRRQEIIREITGKPEWRQEFLATGMNCNLDREHIRGLLDWLTDRSVRNKSVLNEIILWLIPSLNVLSLFLTASGLIQYSVFIAFFLVSLAITVLNLKKINSIHRRLTGQFRFISSLAGLLHLFEKEQFSSRQLIDFQSGIRDSAGSSIRKLGRIIQAFDSRMNVIVGFALNGLLLWDMHCVQKLNRWKEDYENSFPEWLDILGKIDAFISLGNYSFNNPEFTYPVISNNGNVLKTIKLGHQLIDGTKRVCNDFTLLSKGNICIISGANMAGKSTFLRTVAVNYILAMTGAPVCAESMEFTPMKLFTSMRTSDSLSTNESYFYAELRRLKEMQSRIQNGEEILFVLDEILKGTNSEDKSTGSKLFLKKLIGLNATGLIATHDTSLGTLQEEFPGVVFNKCIEIEIDGEVILFDYLLREGITTRRNAVLLMKQMGILD